MRGSIFEPGDRVALSSRFARAVQAHELALDRGTVVDVYSAGSVLVCRVSWDKAGTTGSCLASNLVLASRMHLEAV